MAKARAILKRRKAIRNIRKITKTMQMIATAKFQKSLKRAVNTKPYTVKVRELVAEVASAVTGEVKHPLLRSIEKPRRIAVAVMTSNRGLCGAYNGNVLRKAALHLRKLRADGVEVDLYSAGKRGATFFKFQKMPVKDRLVISDVPQYAEVEPFARAMIEQFTAGEIDGLHLVYMNFISTGVQKPEVMELLPLDSLSAAIDRVAQDLAEKEAQMKAGVMDTKRKGDDVRADAAEKVESIYEFLPSAEDLLNELLPLTVKTTVYQAFLDATTSEHVARMVAMKSATDNAEKMARQLSLDANRARQSQITTELSEIMGGVAAMS
jgi:F-type H+-transporting ATPase subunit gamma